jgi:serine O-acetyltransferase
MRNWSRYILSPYLGNGHWCIKGVRDETVFQGMTLGGRQIDMKFDLALRPELGDFVVVGAGAKVLGGTSLGDNVRVDANSVLLRSVSANVTVAGVPAREVHSSKTEVPEVLKD